MIVRTKTANGYQIQIHENKSGRRRYWAAVNRQPLSQRGTLRPRAFASPQGAWTAALKEAQLLPEGPGQIFPRKVPGYSNPGGGGPFAPMNMPRGRNND
jgi:hypothetical protein